MSHSGNFDWVDIIRFAVKMLEDLVPNGNLSLSNTDYQTIFQNSCEITINGLSNDAKLRIAANRLYYGILQLLIEYYQLDRDTHRNHIHSLIDQKNRQNLKKISKQWKYVHQLRIWADYKNQDAADYYGTDSEQIINKANKKVCCLIHELIVSDIIR